MGTEAKRCSRPGCGRRLYSNNTKGVCASLRMCETNDRTAAQAPRVETPKIVAPAANRSSATDTLKRFRLLAEALAFDPDQVLAGFAEAWLSRARSAVTAGPEAPVRALASPRKTEPATDAGSDDDDALPSVDFLRRHAEIRIGTNQ